MLHSIFSTPILQTKLDNTHHHELKTLCLNLMSENQSTNDGRPISHYFDTGKSLLEHLPVDWFECWLKEQILRFLQVILGNRVNSDLYINECWINDCRNGGAMHEHEHTNSFVSGCYFLQYDPNVHAPLRFYKNTFNSYPSITLPVEKFSEFNTDVYAPQITEGDMLVWQSNVKHGYSNNSGDGRITICFNAIPTSLTNESGYTINISPKTSSS
jgi:uncharacterized protein (TIGR02466 family)